MIMKMKCIINLPHLTVHALLDKLKFSDNDNEVYNLLNDKYR